MPLRLGRYFRPRARDDQEPEGEADDGDARRDDEDPFERAVLLLEASGPPHELPGVIHAARESDRDEQRGNHPDERRDDPEEQRSGGVVYLRAHPHPADGLRAPERKTENPLNAEQERRQEPVRAAAGVSGLHRRAAIAQRRRAGSATDEEP